MTNYTLLYDCNFACMLTQYGKNEEMGFRTWSWVQIFFIISGLARLTHTLHSRHGGGLHCRSASCWLMIWFVLHHLINTWCAIRSYQLFYFECDKTTMAIRNHLNTNKLKKQNAQHTKEAQLSVSIVSTACLAPLGVGLYARYIIFVFHCEKCFLNQFSTKGI